ncbi:MAG: lamin tail domain-containing protein [Saprospiraceae bacterium]|nr:lamin tail domain-containing protein [Saprospiraceae bacterium]
MLRSLLLLYLLMSTLVVSAQWSDDFTDGDLVNGTAWQGNVSDFIVNPALELQLMAPQAGSSQLYTLQDIPDSTIWTFLIRLDFSPSASNALKLILQADQPDLATANGYILDVGETGSLDALRLFRLDGGNPVLLATGTLGAMGGANAICRGRVTRTSAGQWTLEADYTGGQNLQPDLSAQDNTYAGLTNGVFGPVCTYTATRTDKFYFDDFRIEALVPDLVPPAITGVDIIDAQEITLIFSEPVREEEVTEPTNFFLSPDLGTPALVDWSDALPASVRLVWSSSMVTLTDYVLETYTMTDTAGNSADTLRIGFPFLKARLPLPGEVVINEIMADPTPVIALPEAEYVEIHNTTNEILDLADLKLTTTTSTGTLPGYLMLPNSYLILTRVVDASLFGSFGDVMGVNGFPALTNDGSRLRLIGSSGEILDEVNYLDDWHISTSKRDGGWSLELIDPARRCDRQGNWSSSIHPTGGTPGQINSIYQSIPDTTGPRLLHVWPETPSRLILDFDKWVDSDPQPDWFEVSPLIQIDQATRLSSGFQIQLDLATPLQTHTYYQVKTLADLLDCQGNRAGRSWLNGAVIPEQPVPGDILINEVLFDPPVGGSDFIELVNRSSKYLSLEKVLIGNLQPGKEELKPLDLKVLFFPGDHFVLTPDTTFVRSTWPAASSQRIFQVIIPALANDLGNVTLFHQDGPDLILLDQFDYTSDMHHPLLDDPEGVSLERVSYTQPSNLAANWQSAAEDAGFATPTLVNSQYRSLTMDPGDGFTLESKIFSPDGDGWQDALIIRYLLEESGQILNVKVFDREGRFIVDVANSQYLGREGFLVWNGENENGQAVGPGIYVLWFERYQLSGQVDHFKMTAVLALPLE